MKITDKNGTVYELDGVEEIRTVLPMLQASGVLAEDEVKVTAAEAVVGHLHSFVKPAPEAPAPEAPAPKRKSRPTSVYLTEEEAQVLRLLRQHSDGLTSTEIAKIIGKPLNATSALLWRLRVHRPYEDTTTPLIIRVSSGKNRVTALGEGLKIMTARRPNYENFKLGWGNAQ